MNKINFYLFKLSFKYIFINLCIITLFVIFINIIEISRTLEKDGNIYEMKKFNVKYDMLKYDPFLNMLDVGLPINKIMGDAGGATIPFLAAWNFGIVVEEGDHFVAEFEIGKKI